MRLLLALLTVLSLATASRAEAPDVLGWDDLIPPSAPLEDPFRDIADDDLFDLGIVERGRADVALGFIEPGTDEHRTLTVVEAALTARGIDIDGLLAAAKALDDEIRRRGRDVVARLDGRVIRMPGYALPLEASEGGVTEFLLVPYVGACIHTPPPPANQIVYVAVDDAYKLDSLYDPVWVTGRISVEGSSRALSFVDGEANISTGYALRAVAIEPYH